MSTATHATPAAEPAKTSTFLITLAAAIGGFAIFALILFIAYLPQKPAPIAIDNGTRTPEERAAALAELQAREHAAATSYDWVDQEKRIVRIPIDEAMRLTARDLAAGGSGDGKEDAK